METDTLRQKCDRDSQSVDSWVGRAFVLCGRFANETNVQSKILRRETSRAFIHSYGSHPRRVRFSLGSAPEDPRCWYRKLQCREVIWRQFFRMADRSRDRCSPAVRVKGLTLPPPFDPIKAIYFWAWGGVPGYLDLCYTAILPRHYP